MSMFLFYLNASEEKQIIIGHKVNSLAFSRSLVMGTDVGMPGMGSL